MSNDLSHLSQELSLALRDTTFSVWDSKECDRFITWAVADLWPKISREFDPTLNTITLVPGTSPGTYYYTMPSGMLALSRVDLVDTNSKEMGPLAPGLWEKVGPQNGTMKLHIAPVIVDQGGTVRLLGYGRFDTTTNLIPDDYVPLVIAKAQHRALMRLFSNREQFVNWLGSNQVNNVTINEQVQMTREAALDVERLKKESNAKVWMRPVPGRHG